MLSDEKYYWDNHEKISQTSLKRDFTILTKIKPFYVSLMCLVTSCLSSLKYEVGAKSPLGHSITKSATFNALFRRNYNMIIKIGMGNFVSSLISTAILSLGEKYRIPYLYLPWLFNTFKGMFFNEVLALFNHTYTQWLYGIIPAVFFGTMALIMFAEEFCLWCDVFASFQRCWIEYVNHYKQWNIDHNYKSKESLMIDEHDGDNDGVEDNVRNSNNRNLDIKMKQIFKPGNHALNPNEFSWQSDTRRVRSLIAMNYSYHCD